MKEISLVISVYKNLASLQLILKSIEAQQGFPSIEVIVAEDNNGEKMRSKIMEWQAQFSFPIIHVFQEDIGFRKCRILNEAVRKSNGAYLVFIDGDCLLHPKFLAEHNGLKNMGAVTYGRRVMLSPLLSQRIEQEQNLNLIHWPNLIRYGCKRLDAGLYLPFSKPETRPGFWGHNWGIYKLDFESVGGFDESYIKAGIGEDTDIDWRLQQHGMHFQRCKNRLIQYHLYHPENYLDTREVEQILADKKALFTSSGDPQLLMGDL
ncbi:MAG: glycosyltransferase [bacterium]|nr:glycosyltransferase [bacterium]